MNASLPDHTLQLHSLITAEGELRLTLDRVPLPAPAADEVLIRVEATPINPSDIGLLFGAADLATLAADGAGGLRARVPPAGLKAMAPRIGQALQVGNEGAGTVVAAGASPAAQALVGRTVAAIGGGMYTQYRCVNVAACLPLPEGTDAADGASCFVNPLTALGMVETMRREGHRALVHTAAASNLGQMLNRICLEDGIGLVNIVRRPEQAALLRGQGARHVCDSSAPGFTDELVAALAATGATVAFDAIGGGRLAGQILSAMEVVAARAMSAYSRYGSTTHKQVYLYGALDTGPTEIVRNFGFAWGVGGWLLFPFLQRAGAETVQAMRARVVEGLKSTFASHYSAQIGLAEALSPAVAREYLRRATGEKVLVRPQR